MRRGKLGRMGGAIGAVVMAVVAGIAGPAAYGAEKAAAPLGPAEAKQLQADAADALGKDVQTRADLGDGVTLELVLAPAGSFLMGSKVNRPLLPPPTPGRPLCGIPTGRRIPHNGGMMAAQAPAGTLPKVRNLREGVCQLCRGSAASPCSRLGGTNPGRRFAGPSAFPSTPRTAPFNSARSDRLIT